MELDPNTREPSDSPHEAFTIQLDDNGRQITAKLRANDPSIDLALLELADSVAINYPTFLWKVSKDLIPAVCKLYYSVEGFQQKNSGQTLEEWHHLTVIIPQSNKRENYLSELLLDGSTEVGSSGSPLILERDNSILCVGMMYLGGAKSDSSKAASADVIVRYLHTNQIRGVKTVEAGLFFTASHAEPVVPPLPPPPRQRYALLVLPSLCVLLIGLTSWHLWNRKHVVPQPTPIIDSPPVMQCKPEPLIAPITQQGFRILVLSFLGSDTEGMLEGRKIAQQLQLDIEAYKRTQEQQSTWKAAHLTAEGLHTQFLPCSVASHEDARALALVQQFDLVIWGHVTTQTVGAHKEFSVYPFATSTNFNALNKSPDKPRKIRGDTQFQLPSEILPAIDIMLGLYAYEQEQHKVAAHHFRKAYTYITDTQDSWPLLLLMVETLIWTEDKGLTNTILQNVAASCAGNDQCMVRYWMALGMHQRREGKFETALATFQKQALPLAQSLNNSGLSIDILMNIAEMHEVAQSTEQSVAAAEKAQSLSWASTQIGSARVYHRISGWLESRKGKSEEAAFYYKKALDLWEPSDGLIRKASIQYLLGNSYNALGDTENASQYYQASLSVWRKLNNIREQAHLELALGLMWFDKDEYDLAATYLESGAVSYVRLNETQCAARLLSFLSLSKLTRRLGNPTDTQVIDALNRVEPIVGTLGQEDVDSKAYEALALTYSSTGKPQSALEYIDKAIGVTVNIKQPSRSMLLGHLFERKAVFALQVSDKALAKECYEQAVQHYLYDSKNHLNRAILLAIDAACDLAVQQGLAKNCEKYFAIIQDSPESGEAAAILQQAHILTRLGYHAEARRIYTAILQRFAKGKTDNDIAMTILSKSAIARLDNWDNFRLCPGVIVFHVTENQKRDMDLVSLQNGDIIVNSNNQCVSSGLLFHSFIENPYLRIGNRHLPVKVWRNGKTLTVDIPAGVHSLF